MAPKTYTLAELDALDDAEAIAATLPRLTEEEAQARAEEAHRNHLRTGAALDRGADAVWNDRFGR